MGPPEAPYPDVYTDTFIFFLRSLCKIIWMNVHYFLNAPRTSQKYLRHFPHKTLEVNDDFPWFSLYFSHIVTCVKEIPHLWHWSGISGGGQTLHIVLRKPTALTTTPTLLPTTLENHVFHHIKSSEEHKNHSQFFGNLTLSKSQP